MSSKELEQMMTREQKQEVCKAAIVRMSEGRLDGSEFSVDYDRRFGTLFSATLSRTSDIEGRFVHVVFSTRLPIGQSKQEKFETVAEEAAQAVIDIREKSIEAVTAQKPVHPVVRCPCCEARVMIMLDGAP